MKRSTQRFLLCACTLALLAGMSRPALALADLKRGQAALDRGDRATALQEFRALADFGLPQAQIALADMMTSGRPSERNVQEAIRLYLQAGLRDSRGYTRLAHLFATDYTLDPAVMDDIINKLVKRYDRGERSLAGDIGNLLLARGGGHNLPEVKTWALAARKWGDVRGSLQLGQLCDVPLARPEDPACAKKFYGESATSLAESAGHMVALLQRHPELGNSAQAAGQFKTHFAAPERYNIYRVYLKSAAGVPQLGVAETLLADLFNENTKPVNASPFKATELVDPEQAQQMEALEQDTHVYDPTDAAIELLSAYAKNTGPEAKRKFLELLPYVRKVRPLEAALLESSVYIAGTLLPAEPKRAEAVLLPWAERSPQAAFALGNIYRVGYLDEVDYATASRYLEMAARGGMATAWYSLTRLYLGAPAFVPDRQRAEQYADQARKAGFLLVDYLLENTPEMQGAL